MTKRFIKVKVIDNTGQRLCDNKVSTAEEFERLAKAIGKKIK
jgi:hypothetical protein